MFQSIRKHFKERARKKHQKNLDTAALCAAYDKQFKTLVELLDQGANPNATEKIRVYIGDFKYGNRLSNLVALVYDSRHMVMMEELLKRGANPNTRLSNGYPMIAHAASSHHRNMFELLLKYNANPDYQYQDLTTILSHIKDWSKSDALVAQVEARLAEQKSGVTALLPDSNKTTTKISLEVTIRR